MQYIMMVLLIPVFILLRKKQIEVDESLENIEGLLQYQKELLEKEEETAEIISFTKIKRGERK